MIDHIILAMRASPDWATLASDHAAGIPVPPARYFPAHDERFSREIPGRIERWNRLSPISFFACRQRLREIAADNLAKIEGVILTGWEQVPAVLGALGNARILLFYHDDDDWFDPGMVEAIRDLDPLSADALVFPFLRPASNLVTFTRDGAPTAAAMGRCEPFRYRYCTNNYGLTARALARGADLVEHTTASETAAALDFVDVHVDRVISATSKTPSSASRLLGLPDDKAGFDRYISDYVDVIEAIEIPAQAQWVEVPLRETLELFRAVCQPLAAH